jgi:hypothetical protein
VTLIKTDWLDIATSEAVESAELPEIRKRFAKSVTLVVALIDMVKVLKGDDNAKLKSSEPIGAYGLMGLWLITFTKPFMS